MDYLTINYSSFRKEEGYTVVDVDIVTLTEDSFDPTGVKNDLTVALSTVVSDGKIGDYDVDGSESVGVEAPVISMF